MANLIPKKTNFKQHGLVGVQHPHMWILLAYLQIRAVGSLHGSYHQLFLAVIR